MSETFRRFRDVLAIVILNPFPDLTVLFLVDVAGDCNNEVLQCTHYGHDVQLRGRLFVIEVGIGGQP